MSHPFDEPLTPEERAMADRLARLGPRDGPSPALDAKILAAAHAAVAPRRNRRWLALTGVPATLVTGAGMAAVLALAVGVVWQLRPSAPAPRAPRDEAGDFGFVTAEVIERPEPAAAPPPPADAPAPARALQAPAMARREAAPAREEAIAAKQAPAAPAAPAPAPGQSPEHFLDEAVDPSAHSGQATAAAAVRGDSMPYSPAPAPAPAPASPQAAQAAQAAAAAAIAEGEQRQRTAASAMQRKAAANESAKQVAADRDLRSQAASVVATDSAAAAPADAMATQDTASGTELDRIEVTGSRISMADMPVREDRELAPAQWLQRIRDRRDNGDLDGARQSLAQFRKSYPRVRLPDDLRALAEPAR